MSTALAVESISQYTASLPQGRLSGLRTAAVEQLHVHGLPDRKVEDWKYTDLSNIVEISNAWLQAGSPAEQPEATIFESQTALFDVDWLIIRNGVLDVTSLRALQRDDLDIAMLSELDTEFAIDAPLAPFNAALLQDGIHIRVTGDSDRARPLGILYVDHAGAMPGVSATRLHIDVSSGSRARLFELHASSGAASHYANTMTSVRLQPKATLQFLRLQNRAPGHSQTNLTQVNMQAASELHYGGFDFGGDLVRNDLHISIDAADASASFCGLYLCDAQQHVDNHTRVDHRIGPAHSSQEYRGILTGRARGVWNGKAIVHVGADGTDANQANHNLLLSDGAEINAKPELEIYAEDVKCSHGTTVGQLDEKALFYLRTRGIDEPQARQLLTQAFANQIVALAPLPELHPNLDALLGERLQSMTMDTSQ